MGDRGGLYLDYCSHSTVALGHRCDEPTNVSSTASLVPTTTRNSPVAVVVVVVDAHRCW